MKAYVAALALFITTQSFAKTYVLAVVDRAAEHVGKGCDKSFGGFSGFLNKLTEGKREQFEILEYGKGYIPTEGDLIKYYAPGKFQKDDVLWFYYCGHGGTDDVRGHVFKTTNQDVSRKVVRDAMQSAGTRAVILTTDTCSETTTYQNNDPIGSGAPPPEEDHWTALKSLLDNSSGVVDITAASGRNRAFVDPRSGSIFTNAMLYVFSMKFNELNLDLDNKITWPEMFAHFRERTRGNFIGLKHDIATLGIASTLGRDDIDQVPFANDLGMRGPAIPAFLGQAPQKPSEVLYLHQRPLAQQGGETGTAFSVVTRLNSDLVRKDVVFVIAFWDIRNNRVHPQPGVVYEDHFVKRIEEKHLAANDNAPWTFFISDRAILNPRGANGTPENLGVSITLQDLTGKERYATKAFWLTQRDPLGPRPLTSP